MRFRPVPLLLTLAFAVAPAACGGGEVTLQLQAEGSEDELVPVENHVVNFAPYDRDSIFEAMAERAETPEPSVPAELRETVDSVLVLQDQWRTAERRWQQLRDSLQSMKERLDQLDTRSREYFRLFRQWEEVEERVGVLERRKNVAFQQFDGLQQEAIRQADSVEAVISAWENEAFRGYMEITDSIMASRGVDEMIQDTTDARGIVTRSLPGGAWWVYSFYEPSPFEEIYWNCRVQPGSQDTLRLTPDSDCADLRLQL